MEPTRLTAPGLFAPRASDAPRTRRLIGGAVALPAAGILGIAAYLEPSPAGLGTHSQLVNLPPCGWIVTMDLPCPTCGMTTAFAHAAEGQLLAAFLTQPLGGVLAVVTAMVLLVGSYVALTGTPIAGLFGRLWSPGAAWAIGGFAAAAWIYKILSYKGILG